MNHTDILNLLIKRNNYKSYLEIGVSNPVNNFNKIKVIDKQGVDTQFISGKGVFFQTTSDVFFTKCQRTYDLILIDGDHRWMTALRDVSNALQNLRQGGCVVMHDVWPKCEEHTQLKYGEPNYPGNGTAWKAYAILRMSRTDLSMCMVNVGDGVGIICRGSQSLLIPNDLELNPSLNGIDYELNWKFFQKSITYGWFNAQSSNQFVEKGFYRLFPNKEFYHVYKTSHDSSKI